MREKHENKDEDLQFSLTWDEIDRFADLAHAARAAVAEFQAMPFAEKLEHAPRMHEFMQKVIAEADQMESRISPAVRALIANYRLI